MISEQINLLRDAVIRLQALDLPNTAREVKDAADTIEELSAKLASANMERSTAYYNDGWIPCSERLPETDGKYIVCTTKGSVYCTKYHSRGKIFGTDMNTHIEAWQPLPEPYQPKGEK